MNRDKIMTEIEAIQDKVDSMGFKGNNEHDLHLREAIADYIEHINECPICNKPLRNICTDCTEVFNTPLTK